MRHPEAQDLLTYCAHRAISQSSGLYLDQWPSIRHIRHMGPSQLAETLRLKAAMETSSKKPNLVCLTDQFECQLVDPIESSHDTLSDVILPYRSTSNLRLLEAVCNRAQSDMENAPKNSAAFWRAASCLGTAWLLKSESSNDPALLAKATQLFVTEIDTEPGTARNHRSAVRDLTAYWMTSSRTLLAQYELGGRLKYLRGALAHARNAVAIAESSGAFLQPALLCLARSEGLRFEATEDAEGLSNAIESARRASRLPSATEDLSLACVVHAEMLQLRYSRQGTLDDLELAIRYLGAATRVAPAGPEHPGLLSELALALSYRHEHLSTAHDLDEAARLSEEALNCHNVPTSMHSRCLTVHAYILYMKFNNSRDNGALSWSKASISSAIAQTPPSHIRLPSRLRLASNVENALYLICNDFCTLQRSLRLAERGLVLVPPKSCEWKKHLAGVGVKYRQYFRRTKKRDYIDMAITALDIASDLASEEPLLQAALLDNLANALDSRHQVTDSMPDLHRAITVAEMAKAVTPLTHDQYPNRLSNLATKISNRAEATRSRHDFLEALRFASAAVERTPKGHASLPVRLQNLARRRHSLYELDGEESVLSHAIDNMEEALAATPKEHISRASFLQTMCLVYTSKYRSGRLRADLDRALECAKSSAASQRASDSVLASTHNNLGYLYDELYKESGDPRFLHEAILSYDCAVTEAGRTAASATKAVALTNRSGSLRRLWSTSGELRYLKDAEHAMREALTLTPSGHVDSAGRWNMLGTILLDTLETTRQEGCLAEALQCMERSLKLPVSVRSDRSTILQNAAGAYATVYEQFNRIADLERAISLVREAIALTPAQDIAMAGRQHNLAGYLAWLHHRNGDDTTLDESFASAEAAASNPRNADRALYMSGFSDRMENRLTFPWSQQELDGVIQTAEKALALTPRSDLMLPIRMNSLATKLMKRYAADKRTNAQDLDNANLLCRRAVDLLPDAHPDLASIYFHLGKTICFLEWRSKTEGNIFESISCYQKSFRNPNGLIKVRLKAAVEALSIAQMYSHDAEAMGIALDAIRLVQSIDLAKLSREDQQFLLAMIHGLSVEVCSQIQKEGDDEHDHAEIGLAILEATRGVMLGLAVGHIQNHGNEHLASESRVAVPLNKTPSTCLATSRMTKARCAARACLTTFFFDVVFPFSSAGLESLATDRTVVVVVASRFITSYAIVITSAGVRSWDLHGLLATDISRWEKKRLVTLSDRNTKEDIGSKNKEYRAFLIWLWDRCVRSLLCDALQLRARAEHTARPRICWIGAGVAADLPFHAAGDHRGGLTSNTMSLAVSSYAATLRTLDSAQHLSAHRQKNDLKTSSMLAVAMPTTPGGFRPLLGAQLEVEAVQRVSPFKLATLIRPSAADVLTALPEHDFLHIACHGVAHPKDPSRSSLVLQTSTLDDSGKVFVTDHLQVRQIADLTINKGRVAFLSACSTALNEVESLKDEVFHLATSFQLAGYSHVVAAIWSARDDICVEVAKRFYQQLWSKELSELPDADVAYALHDAIMKVRETGRNRDMPLRWAQYVHFGP